MANIWEKAISILAGNLNSGPSYLIKTVYSFQGHQNFTAIAIAADLEIDFCGPCGACRQFMSEFNPEIVIYLIRAKDKMVKITNLDHLLPDCFSPKRLNFAFHNK